MIQRARIASVKTSYWGVEFEIEPRSPWSSNDFIDTPFIASRAWDILDYGQTAVSARFIGWTIIIDDAAIERFSSLLDEGISQFEICSEADLWLAPTTESF